jgi:hypothetical protein
MGPSQFDHEKLDVFSVKSSQEDEISIGSSCHLAHEINSGVFIARGYTPQRLRRERENIVFREDRKDHENKSLS